MAKNIDTNNWQEFRLGDLFAIERGTGYSLRGLESGDTPLVSAKSTNNSIVMYAKVPAKFPANTITVTTDGECGFATVQTVPFDIASNAVALLYKGDEKLTTETQLFVCAVIRKLAENYNYGNKLNKTKLANLMLKFPVTASGIPDWDYMGSYMCRVGAEVKPHVEELFKLESKVKRTPIDTSMWGKFNVADICDILLSHDDLQPKKLSSGDVRLVSAGMTNNGVVMYCDPGTAEVFERGCVTVDMFGQCFFQDEPFVAVSHGRVNILRFKNDVSNAARMYFTAVLNASLKGKYSFSSMCNKKRLTEAIISLPMTSDGVPDWDYMDSYMTRIANETKPTAEFLSELETL